MSKREYHLDGYFFFEDDFSARCAGCDQKVAKVGQTCSLSCYEFMVSMFAYNQANFEPIDLYDQPWYNEEADLIERKAEAHEVDEDLFGRGNSS